jgi:hypothetical protein
MLVEKLTALGIQVNWKKSNCAPSQRIRYLGQDLRLDDREVHTPPEKLAGSLRLTKRLQRSTTIVPAKLAALAGNLLDLQKSNVKLVGLTKTLMSVAGKLSLQGWYRPLPTPPLLHTIFLHTKLALTHPLPLPLVPTHQRHIVITTDASDYGWGAIIQTPQTRQQTHQLFMPFTRRKHITTKETLAVSNALHAFMHLLPSHSSVLVRTDSVVAKAVVNHGSPRPHLNNMLRAAREKLCAKGSTLNAVYIPSKKNPADKLSRHTSDKNEVSLDRRIASRVWKYLRVKPLIDAFASDHNSLLPRFWTWHPSPRASATDALAQDWSRQPPWSLWVNPPWPLIPRVLEKIIRERVRVTVLFPVWKTKPWWPVLSSILQSPALMLKGAVYRDRWGDTFPPPQWRTLAARLDGRKTKQLTNTHITLWRQSIHH